MGAILLVLDRAAAARAFLERAVALRPIYPEAHFNLARVSARQDRGNDALREAALAEAQAVAEGKSALAGQARALARDLRR